MDVILGVKNRWSKAADPYSNQCQLALTVTQEITAQ